MPAKKIDYSTTVIYKIVCNDLAITDLYVGSTTNFRNRKSTHKCGCNGDTKKSEYKIYRIIRENGGWLNWSMLQIEEFPCANGNEARARERYWIEELNAKLNMIIPTRNQKEYYIEHQDKFKELQKKYTEDNKDKIKEYQKKYQDLNKDKIAEQHKEYREANKDKLKESKMRPYICECGSTCKFGNRSEHFKSKKHQAFIAQKDNIET